MTPRTLAAAVIVVTVAGLTPLALAQSGGPTRSQSLADRARSGPPDTEARTAGANLVELVNIRVAQLEEDLNLTPGQLPLWKTYRERVLQLLDDQRRGARISANETTAPKRLDALGDIARNRLTAIEDIVDAGKALYAALTPEQRAVADRRLALPLATMSGQDSGSESRGRDAAPMRPPPPPPK